MMPLILNLSAHISAAGCRCCCGVCCMCSVWGNSLIYCILVAKYYILSKKRQSSNIYDFLEFLVIVKEKVVLNKIYHKCNLTRYMFYEEWSFLTEQL